MGVGGLGGVGGVGGVGLGGGGQVAMLPGGARVSADVATKSLIVYAPASIQPLYEKLIRSLDQRRPQVMIEAQIVAVDTTDNFSLGVEVSTGDRTGSSRLFKFTSFGLSQVDPTSGRLTPIPDLGFNGVLLDPEVADVIVQALTTHARSRLLASPKILVNDNQTGKLESVASVPFRSINTINTISSESLGGDQEAGTIVTVTPHINEDDHLQLEFEVEFSTFTGQGDPNLPPPRQIDRVRSAVTIPDGKTVVVGGLKRIGQTDSFSGVPWVEKVPVLRELTSLTTEAETTTSFFLFIRPKILRDSRFRDLRYLSDIELNEARIPGDFPTSQPLAIPCLKLPTQTVIHPINPLP
jgi:general secretion pathway protein D